MKENGREPRPCTCDEGDCEGWQMAHVGSERAMGYDWPDDSPFSTGDPRYRPVP